MLSPISHKEEFMESKPDLELPQETVISSENSFQKQYCESKSVQEESPSFDQMDEGVLHD